MNIKKICVDLDGVIVNFLGPAFALHGVTLNDENYPDVGWDCVKALNILREGKPPITPHEFWNSHDLNFWRTLPIYKHADKFVRSLCDIVGTSNVFVATSATLDPQCAAGKIDWLNANLSFLSRQYFICPEKSLLAGPDTLLIDDRDLNCEKFRKAGGLAMLFPRPWNSGVGLVASDSVHESVITSLMLLRGIK